MPNSRRLYLLLPFVVLAGCGVQSAPPTPSASPAPATAHAAPVVDATLPTVVAYRSPTCGCCEMWTEHMRAAGFRVDVKTTADMAAVKREAGVPAATQSCHTAHVGGYVVEGHVPADDIKRLLAQKPDALGLAVPGMVPGTPGMGPSGRPYDVLLVAKDGSTSVFAHHGN